MIDWFWIVNGFFIYDNNLRLLSRHTWIVVDFHCCCTLLLLLLLFHFTCFDEMIHFFYFFKKGHHYRLCNSSQTQSWEESVKKKKRNTTTNKTIICFSINKHFFRVAWTRTAKANQFNNSKQVSFLFKHTPVDLWMMFINSLCSVSDTSANADSDDSIQLDGIFRPGNNCRRLVIYIELGIETLMMVV